uniref:Exosome complex component CSL4 C-terminal domain-containing protein n=1 Tax=Glossina brevipalpis TaxID=37001 RepID=A0A1A9W6H9_9MUSC
MICSKKNAKHSNLICLPGQRLCLSNEKTAAGHGTYERKGYIYAALAGTVNIKGKENGKIIEVQCAGNRTIVPLAGDVVTARVLQVNQRFAKCSIQSIGSHVLEQNYRAMLRKEDVRASEKDRVEMYKCYRPGDIILAKVLPQIESSCYQLSTAENELGVVVAMASDSGNAMTPMRPISWTEMQCPNTLAKEPRKVANVVPASALKSQNNNDNRMKTK